MNKNQDNLPKKTSTLTKLIIILVVIIIGLISYIEATKIMNSSSSSNDGPSNSIRVVNTSSSMAESSSTENRSTMSDPTSVSTSSSEESESYAVTFPKGSVFTGENDLYGFAVTTYPNRENMTMSYSPKGNYAPDAHMSVAASFTPITIPTTTIQVNESGIVKDVKVATELKLSLADSSKPSLEFFTPFNGNDTKIYAYMNNSGQMVLAFTPPGNNGPYTTVSMNEKPY
ncbi:hypothetical protein [Enterococcus raffinosus]|uniref:Uncharacterized protein n=1 Tax=Enterococcus raffinosus TaxID=71452 RepID=A0AAW8TCP0_9ENTE|nr:hypothetical protein [Enterococcus raffinosus]MDT2524070.1 hypothetical protein [Enterococcus raffinosus]MDT2530316.1 hypothetical protein [Enterococcus raffinosus]MDT2534949.1 hypothetical protein [Enterococcus raffinosus]MDT2546349.1 hypothetical protein [Enterococcus raffinosus]MDT2554023.1 hypothetical protein [Enterococcus raffinosus]